MLIRVNYSYHNSESFQLLVSGYKEVQSVLAAAITYNSMRSLGSHLSLYLVFLISISVMKKKLALDSTLLTEVSFGLFLVHSSCTCFQHSRNMVKSLEAPWSSPPQPCTILVTLIYMILFFYCHFKGIFGGKEIISMLSMHS